MYRAHGRLFQPGFNPVNLAPFFAGTNPSALYLAGISAVTLATGVSQWNDLAGSINVSQGTAANQPLYPANVFGSMPGVDYDGTNDSLSATTGVVPLDNLWDGGGYIIMALRKDGAGGGGFGTLTAKENAGLTSGWIVFNSVTTIALSPQFSTTDGDFRVTANLTSPAIVEIEYNADSVSNVPVVRINGVNQTVSTSVAPVGTRVADAGDPFYIGNRAIGTRGYDGPQAAVGLYSTIPSAAQKAAMRAYLGQLYGIATV